MSRKEVDELERKAKQELEKIRIDAIASIEGGEDTEKAIEEQIRRSKQVYDNFYKKMLS